VGDYAPGSQGRSDESGGNVPTARSPDDSLVKRRGAGRDGGAVDP